MASILRSGKFVRYFFGFTRNIVFNAQREYGENLNKHSQVLCSALSQGFATSIRINDRNLERSFQKLDQDVRKSGRITRRDIQEILDEIRRSRTASTSQSLLVIRCCGNLVPEELPENRTALVQEIWRTLNKLNVPMDISHYNALLRVFLENEHTFSPTEFLTNLELKGIKPNRITYQRLISRYCQQGDMEGATTILEFMREKEFPINEHVFHALIMGHSEAGDIESAVDILNKMTRAGIAPTADTYTVLLCSYAKVGDINQILSTLDTCEAKEIHLLDKDLFSVIYKLSINGHSDKVDQIIPRLRQSAGYNQDAVNLILRLVNKNQEDVGLKILKTMPRGIRADGELTDTGTFFIKQLVKAKRPVDKILSICKELQSQGLNNRAFSIAVEMGVTSGMTDVAMTFLREIQASGEPIRQHYFWPLICSQAQIGTEAILDVLRVMQSDFNMIPSGETVAEFVVPRINESNYDKIILLLRTSGVSSSRAALSCVCHALSKFKIDKAAELATTYTIYYPPSLLRRPLIDALVETQDYTSFISIIRSIYENLPRLELIRNQRDDESENNMNEEFNGESNRQQSEVVGQIVYDAVIRFPHDRAEVLTKILSGLVEQGLSMSSAYAERIQEKLGSQLTSEISTLLGKLTAGDLEPIPYESRSMQSNFSDIPADQLEKMIEQKEAKGEDTKGLYQSLLIALLKANNTQKIEEIVKKLETFGFVMTSGLNARLIEVYSSSDVNKAIETFREVKAKEPDFKLDHVKTMKVVHELITNDRIDDAVAFLNANQQDSTISEKQNFSSNGFCWKIFNVLAEKGKDADLTRIFECMKENHFIEINNVLLGPLVKVHLVNDDIQKAIEVFETICNEYKCTPFRNEIACKLIQIEDASNLQRLTDLSTNVHGELNSLYDLVFSFIDCGRILQARKILVTPGLHSRPERINTACERYRREGKIESLEALVEATRDLNHIDRHEIFYNLLLAYCKYDKPENVLDLWTKIQEEEGVSPTDQFLARLASYLQLKGIEVPFVVPTKLSETKTNVSTVKSQSRKLQTSQNTNAKGQPNPNTKTSVTAKSNELESLVQEARLEAANKLVLDMVQAKTFPLPSIFRFYLNRVAETGNYAVMEEISKFISADLKKVLGFDNRLCHAYAVAGKSEEILSQLEQKLNNAASTDELKLLEDEFPRGGSFAIFEKQPSLINKFEQLAEKYAEKGIWSPMNIVWQHNFANGNFEKADRIWSSAGFVNSPRLMFKNVIEKARDNKDEQLAHNLINVLKLSKVSERAQGVAHSCLIDILSEQQKFDEALKAVDNAIKDVCLENIHRTTLIRLKDGLVLAGKKFPHTIPTEKKGKVDTSSSSSSSDDEPPAESKSKM